LAGRIHTSAAARHGHTPENRRRNRSPRTLQRRLAAERQSYQQVLDGWRKDAARRHLAASALSIGEIAWLLGFSEPAPFHRAFKRWFGTTPQAFRLRYSTR
jgi:AraC-like DNA-binding protein